MLRPNLRQKLFFEYLACALGHELLLTEWERRFCMDLKAECDPTPRQFNTAYEIASRVRQKIGSEELPRWVKFVGYQDLGGGKTMAMYQVSYDGYTTSLLESTLTKRGIPIPDHPDYTTWKQHLGRGNETAYA